MYETTSLEIYIFEKINRDWTNSFLNWFFPQLTDFHKNNYYIFTLLLICILIFMFYFFRSISRKNFIIKLLVFILGISITGSLSDSISYYGLKKNIERNRPEVEFKNRLISAERNSITQEDNNQFKFPIVRSPFVGDRSFPSNHAANSAAITTFIFLFLFFKYNKKYFSIFILPTLIGYSRIYVGVHWPSDVLSGFLIGAFIGWIAFKIFIKIFNPYFKESSL